MKQKRLNFFSKLVGVAALGILINSTDASAITEHPHPDYLDTWNYGVTSYDWAYSNYYLEAPVRLGSYSDVKDILGNIKSSQSSDYGWAYSGATKKWWWGRANAHFGWYRF